MAEAELASEDWFDKVLDVLGSLLGEGAKPAAGVVDEGMRPAKEPLLENKKYMSAHRDAREPRICDALDLDGVNGQEAAGGGGVVAGRVVADRDGMSCSAVETVLRK